MRPAENGAPAQAVATSSASTATAKTNAEVDDHDTTAFESVAPVVVDPIAASPDAVWYVRPASGGEFGPAKGDVMRRWMEEGRVGADSMVWCEGWPEWQVAGPIFPTLAPVAAQPAADPVEEAKIQVATEPKSLANLEAIQKKTSDLNGRAARQRTAGSGKSIAAVVILGLMIVALFVVLLVVVNS